jgi:hypothetical protein
MFSEKFILLQQEGFLTQSSLSQGLTFLRKANLGDKERGLFYSAFFQLSIGIERFMKIIVILDFMIKNDLKIMTDRELKHNYGHKIKDLYSAIKDIAKERGVNTDGFFHDGIEWDIIHFLHEFALTARYYNLSQLGGTSNAKDPLAEWWKIIFDLYLDEVTDDKRIKIQNESLATCDARGSNSFTMFHSLSGEIMTEYDLLTHPRIIEASSPHSVWFIIKILSPLFLVLKKCQNDVHSIEVSKGYEFPNVPYMNEFFPFLYSNRQSSLRRKKWN